MRVIGSSLGGKRKRSAQKVWEDRRGSLLRGGALGGTWKGIFGQLRAPGWGFWIKF